MIKRNNKILNLALLLTTSVILITGGMFTNSSRMIDDKALYGWVVSETTYVWYKGDSTILSSSEESAHSDYFRVRFNRKAASVLGSDWKLPAGTTFPDSSILLKEVSSLSSGKPELLAVMVKLTSDNNSSHGWLWAEYEPGGKVVYSVKENGKICTGCHKPGRDYVRLFDLK